MVSKFAYRVDVFIVLVCGFIWMSDGDCSGMKVDHGVEIGLHWLPSFPSCVTLSAIVLSLRYVSHHLFLLALHLLPSLTPGVSLVTILSFLRNTSHHLSLLALRSHCTVSNSKRR